MVLVILTIKQIYSVVLFTVLANSLNSKPIFAQNSGSCASEVHQDHGRAHAPHHRDHCHHHHDEQALVLVKKLPEDLAAEEDLRLLGFGSQRHYHNQYCHKLCDLRLKAFAGIVLFLLVRKVVRYVDGMCGEVTTCSLGHNQHHYKNRKQVKNDDDSHENLEDLCVNENDGRILRMFSERDVLVQAPDDCVNGEKTNWPLYMRFILRALFVVVKWARNFGTLLH